MKLSFTTHLSADECAQKLGDALDPVRISLTSTTGFSGHKFLVGHISLRLRDGSYTFSVVRRSPVRHPFSAILSGSIQPKETQAQVTAIIFPSPIGLVVILPFFGLFGFLGYLMWQDGNSLASILDFFREWEMTWLIYFGIGIVGLSLVLSIFDAVQLKNRIEETLRR